MLIENPSMIQMQEESDKSRTLLNKKEEDKYQDDDKMTLPDEIRNLRKQ